MTAGGDNWRWNTRLHDLPRTTGMQVIENPNEKPRQFPVGFAPPNAELPSGDLPENAKVPTPPFAPQIAARGRI